MKRPADSSDTPENRKRPNKGDGSSSAPVNIALNAFDTDVTEKSLLNLSLLLCEMGSFGVDVSEVFNPGVFTNAAPRYGLNPGHAFDMTLPNPHGEP